MLDLGDMLLWMLAMFRATGLMLMLPIFGLRSFPRIARVGLAAMLSWIIMPLVESAPAFPAGLFELILLVAKELSIGILMALAVRMVFFVIEFAAHILAVEVGLHPAPEFDPNANASGNPLGTSLHYLGILIYFSGAHYAVLVAFARSFELVPPGLQAVDLGFVDFVVQQSARVFQLGLLIAAPAMAVNFLINLTFSILGRVVPRMNVFVLSFSLRIAAGLSIVAISAGLIGHIIQQEFNRVPELMLRFLPFSVR